MHAKLLTLPGFALFGWNVPSFTLHTYGALLAIAFLAGLWIAHREAKRTGMDAARITDMAVYVLIGGLIGARLLLLLVDWRHFVANPVKQGDHVRLTHVPGVGLGVRVNNQPGLVIRGVGFSRAAWGTYLGRNHLGVALKEGLTSRLR